MIVIVSMDPWDRAYVIRLQQKKDEDITKIALQGSLAWGLFHKTATEKK